MRFQEEIEALRRQRADAVRDSRSTELMEEHRERCGPYVEALCDSIRRGIRLKAIEGRVSYDTVEVYRQRGEEMELDTRSESNPHYRELWLARYDTDFSSPEFVYHLKENSFFLGETDTLLYFLDEVEKRLEKDGIFPVETVERVKGSRLFGCKRKETAQTIRVSLKCSECVSELRKKEADYARGMGEARTSGVIACAFAFFIEE